MTQSHPADRHIDRDGMSFATVAQTLLRPRDEQSLVVER